MTLNEPRTAIVTGAARRVGAAIAEFLAKSGWTVLAHVHHDADEVPSPMAKVAADLADSDCGERILAAANGLPPVGLLVNNAARFAWDEAGAFDPLEFDSHMTVNARAPALLIEALERRHERGRDACVVNILDSKLAAPNPDYLSYTLSKQALMGVTDLYARALAREGIRVNAVAPALMLRSSGQSAENYAAMHAMNPLGRGVDTADLIDAVIYLAGARAVTGQTIVIDGGHRFLALGRDVQFLEAE
jgi:NAD(P)-dependent dehydrogenase (short-subunit alcohol dehydrogenase family)